MPANLGDSSGAICAFIGYSLDGMASNEPRVRVFSLLACLWAAGAQIWYYAQFRSLFGAFARAFLRK